MCVVSVCGLRGREKEGESVCNGCDFALMYNYVESEINICKALRAFKDRRLKITIIITIINNSMGESSGCMGDSSVQIV